MAIATKRKEASKLNFTKATLEALKPPASGRVFYYDAKTPGLAFAITDKDARRFYLYRRIDGRPERILLGTFPPMTIDQARTAAAQKNGDIARGINPVAAKRAAREGVTLGDLWEWYLENHCKPHRREKTWREYQRQYDQHLAKWKNRRLADITHEHVATLHRSIGKTAPYMANRVLALLSALYGKAIKLHYSGPDPTEGIERFREKSRDRFLAEDELPKFFTALENEPDPTIKDLFRIAILTGARRANVQAMRWQDINFDRQNWRIPDTASKNGEAMDVYLQPEAIAILKARKEAADDKAEWVFPSYGKTGHIVEVKGAWKNLLERAGVKDLRVHDLRRTYGAWLAIAGVSLPVIGKALGHKNPASTAVYARLNLASVRAAVDLAAVAQAAAMKGASNGK